MALSRGECLLRKYRLLKNLTQQELSDRVLKKTGLNISRVRISQFERTEDLMSPEQMRAVCIVLAITEAQLYEWKL